MAVCGVGHGPSRPKRPHGGLGFVRAILGAGRGFVRAICGSRSWVRSRDFGRGPWVRSRGSSDSDGVLGSFARFWARAVGSFARFASIVLGFVRAVQVIRAASWVRSRDVRVSFLGSFVGISRWWCSVLSSQALLSSLTRAPRTPPRDPVTSDYRNSRRPARSGFREFRECQIVTGIG